MTGKSAAGRTVNRTERILTILVPAVSFGGIVLAILLENLMIIPDAGQFWWGCVIGAFLLGYLAYIKPRRDIVSLCVPIFAVLIFIVPMDFTPNIPLQVLFAASITLLLVRLHLRFSQVSGAEAEAERAALFLQEYITRTESRMQPAGTEAGRALASVFAFFRTGRYKEAITACDDGLGVVGGTGVPVKKALAIIAEQLMYMEDSLAVPESYTVFSEEERPFLALDVPKEKVKDEQMLLLDNAMILVYAVADIALAADGGLSANDRKLALGLIRPYMPTIAGVK